MSRYPYADHDFGLVLEQDGKGGFTRTPMTDAQMAAREPALKIARDIYRHAQQAGACYYDLWEIIATAIQEAADPANTIAQLQERVRGLEHRVGELSDYLGAANARTDKARARNRALVEALENLLDVAVADGGREEHWHVVTNAANEALRAAQTGEGNG